MYPPRRSISHGLTQPRFLPFRPSACLAFCSATTLQGTVSPTARPAISKAVQQKKRHPTRPAPFPHHQTACFSVQYGLFRARKRPVSERKTKQARNRLNIKHLASVRLTHSKCRLSPQPFRPHLTPARAQRCRIKQPCHGDKHISHRPTCRTACPLPPVLPRTVIRLPGRLCVHAGKIAFRLDDSVAGHAETSRDCRWRQECNMQSKNVEMRQYPARNGLTRFWFTVQATEKCLQMRPH